MEVVMAFISRHKPTLHQEKLAKKQGFNLVHIGDTDGFSVTPDFIHKKMAGCKAVAVVHPAAALNLAPHFTIGVFENSNRAPEGEAPQFVAAALHTWRKA